MNQQHFAIIQPSSTDITTDSSPPSDSYLHNFPSSSIQLITKTGEHYIRTPLSPFQIKIQVKCCGLSKLDSQVRRRTFPLWKNQEKIQPENSHKYNYLIPGYEVSGIVCEIGKKVNSKAFSVGDSVMGFIPVQLLKCLADNSENEESDQENVKSHEESEEGKYNSTYTPQNNIQIEELNGGCSTECVADAHFFIKLPSGMSFIKASSCIMSGLRAYDTLFYKCSSLRQGDVIFVSAGARWEQTYILQLAILLAKCRVITTVHTDEELNFLRMISSRLTTAYSLKQHRSSNNLELNQTSNDDNEDNSVESEQNQSTMTQLGSSPPFDTQYISSIMTMMRSGSSINPLTILDRRLYDSNEKLQQAIMKETNGLGVELAVLGESVLTNISQQRVSIVDNKSSTTQFIDMCLNILTNHGTLALCESTDQLTPSQLEYMFSKSIIMTHIFEQSYVQNPNVMGRYLRK